MSIPYFPLTFLHLLRIKLARASVGERVQSVKRKYEKTDYFGGFKRLKEYRKDALEEIEKQYLQDVLSFTNGSRKETCRIIGVSRTRLYTLLKIPRVLSPITDVKCPSLF